MTETVNRPSILVVDDSQTIQQILGTMLRQNGFNVLFAGDGVAGLEVLSLKHVDLVLTDLNMPRMDGLTLLKKIRENKKIAALPVIMLSTECNQTDIDKAMNMGATKYLIKPVQSNVLVAAVTELLN